MTIRLYNTLTKTKDVFAPIDAKKVRMYVCGPTVYDYAHIGNARPVIVFDVLFRLLRYTYGPEHVVYVRNITDIDDKINARALARRGNRDILSALRELTEETQRVYLEDVTALGNLAPSFTPRATEHVAQMIAMIARLIAAGHAYVAEGHVLFDVSSKPDYGKLARRSPDDMIAGARIEVAPYKKNPMDFVLWKPSDEVVPGWQSPWGRGRPGWHIECSAMALEYLGESFDIHGGGIDLVFPHHENEIAQSEGAHPGHPLAKIWMHNGFLNVEGEKMSKSLGNFVTIRELLETEKFGGQRWSGAALRWAMLGVHYRQPMNWTVDRLMEARNELERFDTAMKEPPSGFEFGAAETGPTMDVLKALNDDLNLPEAIARIRAQRSALFGSGGEGPVARDMFGGLRRNLDFLGITDDRPVTIDAHVKKLIAAREAARARKDFKESDRIRDELLAKGIELKDGPSGTTWQVKR